MIPLFILAIEDDADRAFMINLYEQCQKAMYYQALDILHDHGEAEDAVHDALIKLMDHLCVQNTAQKPDSPVCNRLNKDNGNRPLAQPEQGARWCK